MKANSRLVLALCLGVILAVIAQPATTHAAFVSNNLIDDMTFDNVNTMTAAGIDSWLNSYFPNSCISTNHGFQAVDPIGYSPTGGYVYGGHVSAGTVIYDAAQAYGLNPQVLLTTLQKEQSLVSGTAGCSVLRYAGAVGYGCPDSGTTHDYTGADLYAINGVTVTSVSGTCVNSISKVGFSQQVIRAAWLLKFGEQRSKGNVNWAVIKGNWNNSDDPQSCYGGPMTQGSFKRCPSDQSTVFYDGYTTIDGTATHMDTGATAALYWYTPHFSGNQNFDALFNQYFGSQFSNDSFSPHPDGTLIVDFQGRVYLLESGQRRYITTAYVFLSYHYKWSSIKNATTGDMWLPEGTPISTLAPGTMFQFGGSVFIMDYEGGVLKKRHVSYQSYIDLGYKGSDMLDLPSGEVPAATASTLLTTPQHVSGNLIVLNGSVYLVDQGQKRHILHPLAFISYGYDWGAIKQGTTMDASLPDGPAVDTRVGTLLFANGGIYVVDSDASGVFKRPVGPWECYANRDHFTSSDWISSFSDEIPSRTGSTYSC